MSGIGAISQYGLAVQEMQMSLIRQQADMMQAVVELLDSARIVPTSSTNGTNVDIQL